MRYEDLISQPRETIEGLLDYLELDTGSEATTAMLKRMTRDSQHGLAHRTTASAEQSIGRWMNDLHPDLQDICTQQLGFALEAFGYPLTRQVPA